jgi:CcmD family protein
MIEELLYYFLQTGVEDPNQFNHFLLFAYVVMWLLGLGYVFSLSNRQRNLQQDIKLMRQLLEDDDKN